MSNNRWFFQFFFDHSRLAVFAFAAVANWDKLERPSNRSRYDNRNSPDVESPNTAYP